MKLFNVYSIVFLTIAIVAAIGIKGSFAKTDKPQVKEVALALIEGKIDQERYLEYSELISDFQNLAEGLFSFLLRQVGVQPVQFLNNK